jgi:hypothetical protein
MDDHEEREVGAETLDLPTSKDWLTLRTIELAVLSLTCRTAASSTEVSSEFLLLS